MLIPSIDLKGGKVVQLVQGRRAAFEDADIDAWVARFSGSPLVQLIDLDAALGSGDNLAIVKQVCAQLPCRVGGGVRNVERAQELLAAGAGQVILGSALYRDGGIDTAFAAEVSAAIGVDRVVGAVDSLGGHVVVRGWRQTLPLTAVDAVGSLEPWCGGFLYTHVDTEGLLGGIDMKAVMRVRAATARRLAVAGGITKQEEIDALDAAGMDAVVGMAIYMGPLAARFPARP
jgi:phosphoribosylformimino-5-aminoimidazole carboxamide ribotide isomerase